MKALIKKILKAIAPCYAGFVRCQSTKVCYITYWNYIKFRLFGIGRTYYPVHPNCTISNPRKVYVGKCSSIARPGNYIQGAGTVHIGDYVRFAMNVGVLSSNHDLYDHNKSHAAPIVIGDYSWLGMGSIVTAGVTLGPRTIVAAGAVVTKSFPEGFCVLAGVPAKVVKTLDKSQFHPWTYEHEHYGMIPAADFPRLRSRYLDI